MTSIIEKRTYKADDKMYSLIADNYSLIQVLSRFGIKMGFGDKTVEEVCRNSGVDCSTFLTVVNFVYQNNTDIVLHADVQLEALMEYLRRSHIYFLEYCLPAIRRKLIQGIEMRDTDISFLILKFFDEYTNEVRTHMQYEETTVFIYISELLKNKIPENLEISTYSEHHEIVSDKLHELKGIILKYCPENADTNLLNDALYDIYRCEQELTSHCRVEDCLLIPAIVHLEQTLRQ